MPSGVKTTSRSLLLALAHSLVLAAQPSEDDLTRRVAVHVLTLPNIESYGAVMGDLADWAAKHPAAFKALNRRAPKGDAGVPAQIAFLQGEPVIQTLLKRHHLTEEAYILVPMATMQASIALLGEQQGRTFPTDRINPANIALVKANQTRIDAIFLKLRADQAKVTSAGGR